CARSRIITVIADWYFDVW
nr:immunoglobulin heavy chain junction region [Mus musculus]NSM07996.1 immunoglobulin heavy chain junction region [Mus musculus]NSM08360.1 immunoglobulin heavy chain junction region [Mus musculus]